MEYVDHVAARVSMCAMTGAGVGTIYSTWKGFPLRSTTFKIASSFAMVGTVVFGMERIGYAAMENQIQGERRLLLTSHAFAGLAGGAVNGYLYHKKPLQGMFYFVPVMMGVYFLESVLQEKRKERLQELMLLQKEEQNRDNEMGDRR
eukprot:scaffold2599_cov125-Cylindrotheca_fusiformis.AAC.5